MTNETTRQIFLSIAPVFIERGIALQERIAAAGGDPAKCTVGETPIIEAYAASAREWAETFARVIDAAHNPETLKGRFIRVRYTIDNAPAVSDGVISEISQTDNFVTLFINETEFVLTKNEFEMLNVCGEVSLGDYYLTLVNG